ncbi:MAG: hypothetical protein GY773_22785, partial [Actinomycetia bacterium]|nr:hypothetical protein [Actinomycetes bacterium]
MKWIIVAAITISALVGGVAGAALEGQVFDGERAMTRCEYAIAEWRAAGQPDVTVAHPFIDEVPAWCETPRAWIYQQGYMVGTWGRLDPIPAREWAYEVEKAIVEAAAEFAMPQDLLEAIINCESSGRPGAVNGYPDYTVTMTRASGLGQHLAVYYPARAAVLGYPADLSTVFDP